jgi:restriction endonuclease S subunit
LEISEIKYSQLREYILGSSFYSKKKQNALNKLMSQYTVLDYFTTHSDIVSNLTNVISYDLTHSLGNYLHDINISETIEGTRKLAIDGDFIISRLRSYLKECAVVKACEDQQVFSTEYLVYRPKTNDISSNTLLSYCLTERVQTILNCSQYGTEHPRFYEFVFNELPLPKCLFTLNNNINNLFKVAYEKRNKSKSLFNKAEALILETIGLKDFQATKKATNIKSLKDSFLNTGRLDAEYYQPKYEDYLNLAKNNSGGYELLENVCSVKDSNYIPNDTTEYKYIELADIGNSGNITGCTVAKGSDLPTRARRIVKTNDVIISSIEGSLESCALITKEYDGALCSTGFYVINSDRINSETLLVLFKSELLQNILKQRCSGTILTAINNNEFSSVPLPLIDEETQQQIASLVSESFSLRLESERLLKEAVEMVEREIENESK